MIIMNTQQAMALAIRRKEQHDIHNDNLTDRPARRRLFKLHKPAISWKQFNEQFKRFNNVLTNG